MMSYQNQFEKMDDKNIKFASEIINASYAKLGFNSIQKRQKIVKQLLTQRQLPEEGLDQLTISYLLDELALMDSNNFHDKIGVGERQSRIFSPLVERRNFYMGHGIGRSGDVMANQPKAAGSSLLLQLCRFLTLSAFKELNYDFVHDVLLLPLATGMALTMAFLTISQQRPERKYVIWSRIDQKTCLKSIKTANLQPVVIEQKIEGDMVTCDHQEIEKKILQIGADKVLCIVSTTSCFAPRVPDDVGKNSQIAKKYGIFHIVNNAYGLWCTKIASQINEGIKNGQCTIVVQSTDKNFLVPVGGSIVFTQKQEILKKSKSINILVSAKYPGRASGSPIVDLFITLLSMGKNSIKQLKKQRKQLFKYMGEKAIQFSKKHGYRLLVTKSNTISMALNLTNEKEGKEDMMSDNITELGSILYSKKVMGHRVVAKSNIITKIGGHQFKNYGSHHQNYPFLPYITFACAVGTKKYELDTFFTRLEEGVKQLCKNRSKKNKNVSLTTQNKIMTEEKKQPFDIMMQELKQQEKEDEEQVNKIYD